MATGIAAILAMAIGPAAASAASVADDSGAQFGAGTPDAGARTLESGWVQLAPTGVSEGFDALPAAGWTMSPWTGGNAVVGGGALTVDGARFGQDGLRSPDQVLEFRASFGGDASQHAGLGEDFDTGSWAMFSTWVGGGLYVRTRSTPVDEQITPIAITDFNPAIPHDYRVEWSATAVRYSVDGVEVTTHNVAIASQLRPLVSDYSNGGNSVSVDWLGMAPYATSGSFDSRILDAGDARARWDALTATASGDTVAFDTRSGNTPVPDGTWSAYQPVGGGGAIASPAGRYIQYRARLSTANDLVTPMLDRVEIGYEVDTVAPTAGIDDVQVSGATATVEFSSAATDLQRLECKLDAGDFATCTSPKQLTGLSDGAHTISVRAIDTAGNTGTADEETFNVDTVAPTAAIDDVQVTGATATATFSSAATDFQRFECSLDAGAFVTCPNSKQFPGLSAGSHTIHARGVDTAGNVGPQVDQAFTVVAPTAAIDSVDVLGTTATVSFSSPSAGVARLECSLDGATFATCTSPKQLTALSDGAHTIAVRAVDTGNNASTVVEETFNVDTVAPTAEIDDVVVSGATATATFSSAATDLQRFECSRDGAAFAICTSPKQLTALGVGSHTIAVRAIDKVGNVGSPVQKAFTVANPPADTPPPGGGDPQPPAGGGVVPDKSAPGITVGSRTLRVSKSGKVGLKLGCPAGETRCTVSAKLRLGKTTVASRTATIAGGKSATLTLTLSKAARKRLAKGKRLKLTALITATDAAGNRSTSTTALTLRA